MLDDPAGKQCRSQTPRDPDQLRQSHIRRVQPPQLDPPSRTSCSPPTFTISSGEQQSAGREHFKPSADSISVSICGSAPPDRLKTACVTHQLSAQMYCNSHHLKITGEMLELFSVCECVRADDTVSPSGASSSCCTSEIICRRLLLRLTAHFLFGAEASRFHSFI